MPKAIPNFVEIVRFFNTFILQIDVTAVYSDT